MNNIVTLSNATGLKISYGNNLMIDPMLSPTISGSGTSADPTIASYAFEFTEAQVNSQNLPDVSSDKEVTCYMNSELIDSGDINENLDLTTYANYAPITAQIQSAGGNSGGNNSPDDNTSGAINMIGNRAIIALMAIFGFMIIY